MATKPRDLVTRFLSDVQGFLRGTDQIGAAFEDMARDQEDLSRQGEETARDLARAYDRASDQIKRDARDTEHATKEGFADTGREAGEEFVQNLGEAVSSGDLSGLLSGTVGGLAGTFGAAGPIGAAFAALATVGAVVFTGISESAKKAAEATQEAFDNIQSNASNMVRQQSQVENALGKENWLDAMKEADRLGGAVGLKWEQVAEIIGSGAKDGAYYKRLVEEVDRLNQKSVQTGGELTNLESRRRLAAQQIVDATNRSAESLQEASKWAKENADWAERANRNTGETADNAERTARALKVAANYYSKLGAGAAYAPGGSTYNSQVPGSRYTGGKRD